MRWKVGKKVLKKYLRWTVSPTTGEPVCASDSEVIDAGSNRSGDGMTLPPAHRRPFAGSMHLPPAHRLVRRQ
jgi:hypothetical protein